VFGIGERIVGKEFGKKIIIVFILFKNLEDIIYTYDLTIYVIENLKDIC
jgi:hypothetical protein